VAPGERAVVVEVDDHGGATLRLNAPPAGGTLEARYWIGNGTEGNAEAEAINAVLWPGGPGIEGLAAIVAVRNPLPAVGGTDPEDAARAKHAIPGAFAADQPRALVAADYAELARAVRGVRRAAAQMLFTGSRPAVDVAVQPAVGEDPAATLLATVERALERVRRIGHVVRVRAPRYRPLVLGLDVALVPEAVRSDVADELARVLSSGWLRDGSPGLFNPGRLGFGASVYASAVIAAVHRIAGVRSAVLTSFGFLAEPAAAGIRESLSVGALEIPRLDNDPAAPDRGYTSVVLEGGR
jgi:predicted phage baseplate assembly protein